MRKKSGAVKEAPPFAKIGWNIKKKTPEKEKNKFRKEKIERALCDQLGEGRSTSASSWFSRLARKGVNCAKEKLEKAWEKLGRSVGRPQGVRSGCDRSELCNLGGNRGFLQKKLSGRGSCAESSRWGGWGRHSVRLVSSKGLIVNLKEENLFSKRG